MAPSSWRVLLLLWNTLCLLFAIFEVTSALCALILYLLDSSFANNSALRLCWAAILLAFTSCISAINLDFLSASLILLLAFSSSFCNLTIRAWISAYWWVYILSSFLACIISVCWWMDIPVIIIAPLCEPLATNF